MANKSKLKEFVERTGTDLFNEMPEVVTVPEAAKYMKCSKQFVYKDLLPLPGFPVFKIAGHNYIKRDHLKTWLLDRFNIETEKETAE